MRDAARERRRGSAARHVPGDHEDEPAAFLELAARPRQRTSSALAGQEPLLERPADEPAERVRDPVAAERAERARRDHPTERQIADDGEQPGGDQRRFARQQRNDGVAQGEREHDQVRLRRL